MAHRCNGGYPPAETSDGYCDETAEGLCFLNYLRCHDDIGWGLDYEWLKQFGIAEAPHKNI